jgi:hypothetical protein
MQHSYDFRGDKISLRFYSFADLYISASIKIFLRFQEAMTYFYDFVHLRICVSVSIRVGLSFDFMIIKYSFNIIHLHVCIYFSFDKNILTSSIKKHCYFSGDNIFL